MRSMLALVGVTILVVSPGKASARPSPATHAAAHEAQSRREIAPTPALDSTRRNTSVAIVVPAPPSVPAPVIAEGDATEACAASLRALGHAVRAAAQPPPDNSACVIERPVSVEALSIGEARVALPDKPILACGFAKAFGEFATQLASPLARSHLGAAVASIATGPGYECRGRNRVAGAKISAHGKGIAIDVASLRLADGRVVSVEKPKDDNERRFLSTIRAAACGWFTTVLGPGSDAAHANHLHLDSETHGSSNRYRLCQ